MRPGIVGRPRREPCNTVMYVQYISQDFFYLLYCTCTFGASHLATLSHIKPDKNGAKLQKIITKTFQKHAKTASVQLVSVETRAKAAAQKTKHSTTALHCSTQNNTTQSQKNINRACGVLLLCTVARIILHKTQHTQ